MEGLGSSTSGLTSSESSAAPALDRRNSAVRRLERRTSAGGLLERKSSLLLRRWKAVKDVQALRRIYEDALAECEEVRAHAEQLNTVATEREREVARIQGDLEAIQSTMRDQEGQLRVLSGRLQQIAIPIAPVEEMTSDMAILERDIVVVEQECERLEASVTERSREMDDMEQALRDVTEDTAALRKEILHRHRLQEELLELEAERSGTLARLERKLAKCRERREMLEHLESQSALVTAQAEQFTRQSDELDRQGRDVAATHSQAVLAVAALHQSLLAGIHEREALEDVWANEKAGRESAEQQFLEEQAWWAAKLNGQDDTKLSWGCMWCLGL